jgi:hypothetical protein
MGDGSILDLHANLDSHPGPMARPPEGRAIFDTAPAFENRGPMDDAPADLPPWFVAWRLIAP